MEYIDVSELVPPEKESENLHSRVSEDVIVYAPSYGYIVAYFDHETDQWFDNQCNIIGDVQQWSFFKRIQQ